MAEMENEMPQNSNMSGDDIFGYTDFCVSPLAALFTQNMVVAPSALTGLSPVFPYDYDKNDKEQEEDPLRR